MTARRLVAYVLVVVAAGAICGLAYRDVDSDLGPLRIEVEIDHSHHEILRGP